jgi:prevent-host-death family protein
MDVGIRELKAKLSEHVQRASDGETIVVTDRGRPVARLVPYDTSSAVERGIEQGWIEPARRTGLGHAERHRSTRSVIETLDADRS